MRQAIFKLVTVSLLTLIGLAGASDSSAVAIGCDVCSAAQLEQLVRAAGNGEHEVYSFAEGTVRAYSVDIEPGPDSIVERPPSMEALQAAAGFKEMFDQSDGAMKVAGAVDAGDLGARFSSATAFTVIQDANLRAQLGDRLSDSTKPLIGLSDNVNGLRAMATRLIVWGERPVLALTVTFQGGTSVNVEIDLTTELAVYMKDSARTADGQLIPETATQGDAGTWTGEANRLIQIGEHMQNRGADFALGSCRVGIDPHLTCAWDAAANQLACRLFSPCD